MRDLLRKGERREEMMDIVSLVEETVKMLGSDAIARNCSVTVNSERDVPLLSGDPIQLKQVILNLMVNALDAVSENGVPGVLAITTSSSNGWVEINVSDNGPGLPDDVTKDCFAPFETTKPEGLGMGLPSAGASSKPTEASWSPRPTPKEGPPFAFSCRCPLAGRSEPLPWIDQAGFHEFFPCGARVQG